MFLLAPLHIALLRKVRLLIIFDSLVSAMPPLLLLRWFLYRRPPLPLHDELLNFTPRLRLNGCHGLSTIVDIVQVELGCL